MHNFFLCTPSNHIQFINQFKKLKIHSRKSRDEFENEYIITLSRAFKNQQRKSIFLKKLKSTHNHQFTKNSCS